MHSSGPHRARIIAGPSRHMDPAPARPSPHLRRQAERFRLLFAGARADIDADAYADADTDIDAPHSDATPTPAALEMPCEPEIPHNNAESHDEPHGDANEDDGRDDGNGRDGDHDAERSSGELDGAPHGFVPIDAPTLPQVGAAHGARALGRYGAGATAAIEASAKAKRVGDGDVERLVESIVDQVADFCSNPAVLARGDWHITIPIDPALLPACTLSLTLSHFDLTLRFDTTEERSRQLILQHATTLRESLAQVMQSRFDPARSIEIIVM
jgi:type III secretion control protein HpaP